MPFPTTFAELASAGYHFSGHSTCKGCGKTIEWWKTPAGKTIPLDLKQNAGA